MLLGYAGAAIIGPFLEVYLLALLLEGLVLVPLGKALLEC